MQEKESSKLKVSDLTDSDSYESEIEITEMFDPLLEDK